jgi:hypothetical protein
MSFEDKPPGFSETPEVLLSTKEYSFGELLFPFPLTKPIFSQPLLSPLLPKGGLRGGSGKPFFIISNLPHDLIAGFSFSSLLLHSYHLLFEQLFGLTRRTLLHLPGPLHEGKQPGYRL